MRGGCAALSFFCIMSIEYGELTCRLAYVELAPVFDGDSERQWNHGVGPPIPAAQPKGPSDRSGITER